MSVGTLDCAKPGLPAVDIFLRTLYYSSKYDKINQGAEINDLKSKWRI